MEDYKIKQPSRLHIGSLSPKKNSFAMLDDDGEEDAYELQDDHTEETTDDDEGLHKETGLAFENALHRFSSTDLSCFAEKLEDDDWSIWNAPADPEQNEMLSFLKINSLIGTKLDESINGVKWMVCSPIYPHMFLTG